MPSSSLDEILAAVRIRLETRRKAALERAEAIKKAADAYATAVERESLAELAGKVDVGIAASGGASARAAAQALRAVVVSLPELAAPSSEAPPSKGDAPAGGRGPRKRPWKDELAVRSADVEGVEQDGLIESAPLLRASARKMRVVVVGGLPKREKVARLSAKLGFELEWIGAERAGAKAIRSLEGRVLDGHVAALVLLDGFIAHSQSEPLLRAARQTGTPIAYGDKGGLGALAKALRDVESELARRAQQPRL